MNIPSILKQIVETKKSEVEQAYKQESAIFVASQQSTHKIFDFTQSLRTEKLAIIAEIKRGSPSAGIICEDFHPVEIAKAYQKAGAQVISCLTDQDYFYGKGQYIIDIRPYINIPILRKDFIIDPIQIYETRSWGADAFLLIVAILDLPTLKKLYQLGKELGLEALIEVHNEQELEIALSIDAPVIGINNRNLHDFTIDLKLVEKLKPLVPRDKIIVGESGIKTIDDARSLYNSGVNALLIGEGFMSSHSSLSWDALKEL